MPHTRHLGLHIGTSLYSWKTCAHLIGITQLFDFGALVLHTGKVWDFETYTILKSSTSTTIYVSLIFFEKVSLKPGETKEVSLTIDKAALSFFDPVKHDWVAEPGDFEALIGNSSSDIKTKLKFSLQ